MTDCTASFQATKGSVRAKHSLGHDVAKLPYIASIAGWAYPEICPNDPLCLESFGTARDKPASDGFNGARSEEEHEGDVNRRGPPSDSSRRALPLLFSSSLVYKLCVNGIVPGVEVDRGLFREVHRSKLSLVRIYEVQQVSEESKQWSADPANRKCDAPGSWYCPGRYPPGLPLSASARAAGQPLPG